MHKIIQKQVEILKKYRQKQVERIIIEITVSVCPDD